MPCPQGIRLQIEALEARYQPDGSVSVLQIGGIVRLLGDAANNGVVIEATGTDSLTISGDGSTTISGPTSVTGVTRLYLELGAGNDTATITASVPFGGQIIARLGKGSDSLSVGDGQYDNTIVFLDHNGDDQVTLSNGVYKGKVILSTGTGNDTVVASSSQFAQDFQLSGGRGNDLVQFSSSSFNDRVVIHTDDGNDRFEIEDTAFSVFSLFDLGTGHDKASLSNVSFPFGKPVSVLIGGLGVDTLTITGLIGTLITRGFFP